MEPQSLNAHKLTSVSLRKESFRHLKQAQTILSGQGAFMSEQEIFRGLICLYLQKWRGSGSRTAGLRRYNLKGLGYVVKPMYLEMSLLAAAWGRAVHSGISISRMLDFAIRNYLRVFVQMQIMNQKARGDRRTAIDYKCKTWKNSGQTLHFVQLIEFFIAQPMPP